jgi:hypothetical protein
MTNAVLVNRPGFPKRSITPGQAFEKYFEAKARKKSLSEDRRQAEHLKAAFGADTPLVDITSARISITRRHGSQ